MSPSEYVFLSREIAVESYHRCEKCPFQYSFAFIQESFDDLLWGATNRFGLRYNLMFGEKSNLFLKSGTGIGFATSYGASSFSTDVYLKLYYWIFFVFLDTSFFTDGLFNKNGIGVEFKLWEILFDFGLSNFFVSDYESGVFKLRFEIGAGYEF